MGFPCKTPERLAIFRQFSSVCERSEFENFREENGNQAKNSGLSGCTFLCLLSFVQAKESESPSAKSDISTK
jgi:hypothetical protein